MALSRMKRKKRNRYVWRWDFSLREPNHYNSEIGRELRKHRIVYKSMLWIGAFSWCVVILFFIGLLICRANLIYIELSGIAVLITGIICGKIIKIPKLTKSEIKKLEDEINTTSDRIEKLDVILTENTLVIQSGILIFRLPYLEIAKIRIRRYKDREHGTRIQYRLCDGTKIETIYHGLGSYSVDGPPFVTLWEQLLKYNPNIVIENFKLFDVM